MSPYISLDFKTSSSFFTIHTQASNIFCIHASIIHEFNKLSSFFVVVNNINMQLNNERVKGSLNVKSPDHFMAWCPPALRHLTLNWLLLPPGLAWSTWSAQGSPANKTIFIAKQLNKQLYRDTVHGSSTHTPTWHWQVSNQWPRGILDPTEIRQM